MIIIHHPQNLLSHHHGHRLHTHRYGHDLHPHNDHHQSLNQHCYCDQVVDVPLIENRQCEQWHSRRGITVRKLFMNVKSFVD